nr:hypothetical protein [uncultured Flavobacterium sp.]
MELTITVLKKLGFQEIQKKPLRTFIRTEDNIILYEYLIPIWLVQLDGTVGEFANLRRVITEDDLQNAINSRNIR